MAAVSRKSPKMAAGRTWKWRIGLRVKSDLGWLLRRFKAISQRLLSQITDPQRPLSTWLWESQCPETHEIAYTK